MQFSIALQIYIFLLFWTTEKGKQINEIAINHLFLINLISYIALQ